MNSDLITLITAARQKVLNTIMLVEASLSRITPYDVNQNYTPEEMEPYDAMSGRFIRAIEVSLKFFRTYERYLFVESSDTIRDLLNRMAMVDLIASTQLWVAEMSGIGSSTIICLKISSKFTTLSRINLATN